jgi:hypothetical protein
MGLQSGGSPNFGNFETPNLGVTRKMTFECNPHGQSQRILERGRWWLPPSLSHGEFCESMYVHGLFMHQKCSNYTLINLLFGLCRSIWIIDSLAIHSYLHPRVPTCPFYLQNAISKGMYPSSFYCFHFETSIWVFQGVWGALVFFYNPNPLL